jgi:diguanylate cyclase (GGDEF)-like protein
VIGINTDLTATKLAEAQLQRREEQMIHLIHHDSLTGLPNRTLLLDRLNRAIKLASRNAKSLGVLFLDLDGFKQVNDSLGHAIGDKLLKSVALRLESCSRASDTVSRHSGDEFVVLLNELHTPDDAAFAAERILQTLSDVHSISHRDLEITASIGITLYPDHGLDAKALIKNADTAMYRAKKVGRNTYKFFEAGMTGQEVGNV